MMTFQVEYEILEGRREKVELYLAWHSASIFTLKKLLLIDTTTDYASDSVYVHIPYPEET